MVTDLLPSLISIIYLRYPYETTLGLPWCLSSEEFVCNAGGAGGAVSIPGLGRSPGGGHGNPLQYSCLENPMDRGAWWVMVHGVTESQTRDAFQTAVLNCLYLLLDCELCDAG